MFGLLEHVTLIGLMKDNSSFRGFLENVIIVGTHRSSLFSCLIFLADSG
jgi:hypothetical protein